MPGQAKTAEFELRDYLRVIWRRRLTIALSAAVVCAVSVVASLLQTPVYASTSEVLLQPRIGDTLFNPDTGVPTDPTRAIDTEIRILQSQPIREAVRKELGSAPKVRAQAAGKTNVIEVTSESTDAKRAATIANAYSRAYVDFRKRQQVEDLLAASKEVQDKITELQRQIDVAATPQKEALIQQQALFKQKLDQLQVDAALKTGGAQLVTEASVPDSPVKPKPLRNGLVALVAGVLFGLAVAFLVDYLDDSVKTKDDLSQLAPTIPVIGLIPLVQGWRVNEEPRIISIEDPKSAVAEAYRTLRTSIQFLSLDRPIRTLQITSPGAQEGKSTTIANLGVALARAGQRVIIVCCDLRRPRIHRFFGLDNDIGFTSVLLGKVPLTTALQQVPDQPRLSLLASGPLPPNPSELLSSRRTVEVLSSLQAQGNIVLVDAPPVLPVTDALVLSGRVDATVLVCVAGATTRKDAARALELLEQLDAPVIGTVLNGVSLDETYGYGEYYRQPTAARPAEPVWDQPAQAEPAERP